MAKQETTQARDAAICGNCGHAAGLHHADECQVALCGCEQYVVDTMDALRRALPQSEPPSEAGMTPAVASVADAMREQTSGQYHPYTCGNRHDGKHAEILGDLGVLIPTVRGWMCPFCDWTQPLAYFGEASPSHPSAPAGFNDGARHGLTLAMDVVSINTPQDELSTSRTLAHLRDLYHALPKER